MTAVLWTGAEIAAATGGALSAPFVADAVAFDSREVGPGALFVALRGSNADGHAFVAAAAAAGAAGHLVERAVPWPHVRVADSLAGLQDLARASRARMKGTVIGVTGSVGKTSTKEALRLALARLAPGQTHASVKSYNNHTGVPLSLARMPADSRFGVFEMGMNHAGEIAALTRLVRPHIAVITWVGAAHIEFFPDGEAGIARAKAEILEGVEAGGTAIWPADNAHAPILAAKAQALGLDGLSFGFDKGADVRALAAEIGPFATELQADVAGEIVRCRIGAAGRHWVSNALAVLAALKAAGADLQQAAPALADLQPALAGRGARLRIPLADGMATLIDGSYNANPVSMRAALAVLRELPAGRRLAVLGAMRELGADADAAHRALAPAIAAAGVDRLALVGPEMAALQLAGAVHLADAQAALHWLRQELQAGDAVLVKGSNSVGLGALVAALGAVPALEGQQ